jgi:hypothetical protein
MEAPVAIDAGLALPPENRRRAREGTGASRGRNDNGRIGKR